MLRIKRTLKLIKYDMRAMLKYWWIIGIITPITALASAFLFRAFLDTFIAVVSFEPSIFNDSSIGILFGILLLMVEGISAYILSIIFGLTFFATQILIFIRFFKHFYTDEGYLTFTLPVSRRELYLAKVFSSMIITVAQFAIMMIGVGAMIIIAPASDSGIWIFDAKIWRDIFESFNSFSDIAQIFLILVNLAIVVVAIIGSLFASLTLMHLSITIGSVVAKRGKVFAAIGFWYVMSYMLSALISALYYAFYFLAMSSTAFIFELSTTHLLIVFIPLVMMIAAIFWTVGFLFYNLTQSLIDKKLNLA